MSEIAPTAEQIAAAIKLQEDYSKAYPTQDLLEDINTEVLPNEYRNVIQLRSDRDHFYVAFSDDPKNLEPTEEGFIPNAHLKQISAMTGPRKTGSTIKEWIDNIRSVQSVPK